MQTFSNCYQDLRPVLIPTFEKYLHPAPKIERQFVYDTLVHVPYLGIQYSVKQFYELYSEMESTTSRVDIKLTQAEIMAIRNTGMKTTKAAVSTMDCLVAYLVTVLNRTDDMPISKIFNIIEVGHTWYS